MTQSFDSAPSPLQTPPIASAPPTNQQLAIANLMRRTRSGASNFYWIAALSLINTILAVAESQTRFVIGLAVTQFVDAFAYVVGQDTPALKTMLLVIAFVIDFVIIGLFALFGYLSTKGRRWAFITGIVLYAFDAVLMLIFQDWLGLAFHAFFLWGLFNGLNALNQLQKFLPPKTSDFPQSIGVA
jgi:hypothetical protein